VHASSLLALLAGPDRRSIGRSPLVVRRVLHSPALLPALVRGLSVKDPLVRMRAADALEKVAHHLPNSVQRYRTRILRVAEASNQPEVQWHMAQLLPRLELDSVQRAQARHLLRRYLGCSSSIVQTMALDALVRLAPATRAGQAQVGRLLDAASTSAFAAVRARARRLRAALRKSASGPTV
jgi:hypothetical protein